MQGRECEKREIRLSVRRHYLAATGEDTAVQRELISYSAIIKFNYEFKDSNNTSTNPNPVSRHLTPDNILINSSLALQLFIAT
jgi:hypothetical protein